MLITRKGFDFWEAHLTHVMLLVLDVFSHLDTNIKSPSHLSGIPTEPPGPWPHLAGQPDHQGVPAEGMDAIVPEASVGEVVATKDG